MQNKYRGRGGLSFEERIAAFSTIAALPDEEVIPLDMASIYLDRAVGTISDYICTGLIEPVKYGVSNREKKSELKRDNRLVSFKMKELRRFKQMLANSKPRPVKLTKKSGQPIDYSKF